MEGLLEKASWRATFAEKPKRCADCWQCKTQSGPACGGSGGTDGEDPDVEAEGLGPPLEDRRGPKTKAGVAKREPQGSALDCGSLELWKGRKEGRHMPEDDPRIGSMHRPPPLGDPPWAKSTPGGDG